MRPFKFNGCHIDLDAIQIVGAPEKRMDEGWLLPLTMKQHENPVYIRSRYSFGPEVLPEQEREIVEKEFEQLVDVWSNQ